MAASTAEPQVKEEQKVEANGNAGGQNRSGHEGANRRGGHFGGRGGKFVGGPRKQEFKASVKNEPGHEGGGGRGGFAGRGRRGNPNRDRPAEFGSQGGNFFNERLLQSLSGPTLDLPPQDDKEKKFNAKCRLYVGNLPADLAEDEFRALFTTHGEVGEVYINKEKNFAFVRLDYKSTAEKVKRELDGFTFKGRSLRVRFAPIGSVIKVINLTQYVTNELLEAAFSVFGEVERAIVIVDERGNSMKEGIVEFARKPGAQSALRYCSEGCFFLTSSLKPVIVEPYTEIEDTDGLSEKSIIKKGPDFYEAREVGPRFAKKGSFEFEYGTRWKQIYELFKQKEEALKREMKLEEEKLEAQMQYAKYEHETEVLREQLRQREADRERQKREWENKERQAEEQRLAEEQAVRRQQEDMSRRMNHQDDEMRRRHQENNLFVQAQQLTSLMDKQEANLRPSSGPFGGGNDPPRDQYSNFGRQRELCTLPECSSLSDLDALSGLTSLRKEDIRPDERTGIDGDPKAIDIPVAKMETRKARQDHRNG